MQLFDALSDVTRLKIVLILSRHDVDASCQALSQQFKLSQPAMSHHFKILKESKLIKVRKDGRKVYYSLNRERLGKYLQKFMRDMQVNITRPLARSRILDNKAFDLHRPLGTGFRT